MADASAADQCLAPDVELDQAIVGHVYKGVEAVKNLVTNHYAKVRTSQARCPCQIAASPHHAEVVPARRFQAFCSSRARSNGPYYRHS